MSIFLFVLGLLIGFAFKLGFDEYYKFKLNQEKTASQMEDVLARFKAIEMIKDKKLNSSL